MFGLTPPHPYSFLSPKGPIVLKRQWDLVRSGVNPSRIISTFHILFLSSRGPSLTVTLKLLILSFILILSRVFLLGGHFYILTWNKQNGLYFWKSHFFGWHLLMYSFSLKKWAGGKIIFAEGDFHIFPSLVEGWEWHGIFQELQSELVGILEKYKSLATAHFILKVS